MKKKEWGRSRVQAVGEDSGCEIGGTLNMDMFEPFLFGIEVDFIERKINAQVFDLDSCEAVLMLGSNYR